MTNLPETQSNSEIILYQTEDGQTRIQVRLQNETVWMSLNQMAELFQRDKSVISRHIRNIFTEGELRSESTVAKFATVQSEGSRQVTRDVDFYNLDVIISVGYRVKSHRGTQFRRWATERLNEYLGSRVLPWTMIASKQSLTSAPTILMRCWKGIKVRKGDVTIAKNYLNANELEGLNRIVTMYLDYAEDQAKRHRQIFMRDWRKKLDAFLQFNERDILINAGQVSKAVADQLAIEQYEIFRQHRLAEEAQQESLADDAELKRYLEKKK